MRQLLVMILLAATALAGCAEETDEPVANSVTTTAPIVEEALVASHPVYKFLTNDALPYGDGTAFYEDVGAQRIWFKPPQRPLPDSLTTMEPIAQTSDAVASGGIAVFGSFAYYGGRSSGPMYVVDIRDPANPVVMSETDGIPMRDADTIAFPDGRLILISTNGGRSVVATDVTNPLAPEMIGVFDQNAVGEPSENGTLGSGHNIAVVPGTPIVYNSGMDIIDFSDPMNPRLVGNWGGDGCHDIAFYIDASENKSRAYCAGYANSEIWDIANPLAPELIIEIPFPGWASSLPGPVGSTLHDTPATGVVDGLGLPDPRFSHLAIVNHDATMLIVGDETGGGAANACDFYVDGGEAGTLSGPIGNLFFYDITDEENPVLGGHVSPSFLDAFDATSPTDSCTAHFGKIIEDTGFLVMGFYGAGVSLIDFRDMYNPVIVDQLDQGGQIWDVWYHAGRLYTGDMERGLDVINLG